jgi:hypothetical protein
MKVRTVTVNRRGRVVFSRDFALRIAGGVLDIDPSDGLVFERKPIHSEYRTETRALCGHQRDRTAESAERAERGPDRSPR